MASYGPSRKAIHGPIRPHNITDASRTLRLPRTRQDPPATARGHSSRGAPPTGHHPGERTTTGRLSAQATSQLATGTRGPSARPSSHGPHRSRSAAANGTVAGRVAISRRNIAAVGNRCSRRVWAAITRRASCCAASAATDIAGIITNMPSEFMRVTVQDPQYASGQMLGEPGLADLACPLDTPQPSRQLVPQFPVLPGQLLDPLPPVTLPRGGHRGSPSSGSG